MSVTRIGNASASSTAGDTVFVIADVVETPGHHWNLTTLSPVTVMSGGVPDIPSEQRRQAGPVEYCIDILADGDTHEAGLVFTRGADGVEIALAYAIALQEECRLSRRRSGRRRPWQPRS